MLTRELDQQLFDIIFDDGEWFRIPVIFIRHLSYPQAIMLAFLIGQSCRVRAWHRRKGKPGREWKGWFYCTAKQIYKILGLPERTQRRILQELKNLKLIRTARRGIPPKRYIQIEMQGILEFAAEYSSGGPPS